MTAESRDFSVDTYSVVSFTFFWLSRLHLYWHCLGWRRNLGILTAAACRREKRQKRQQKSRYANRETS